MDAALIASYLGTYSYIGEMSSIHLLPDVHYYSAG
jgi:hypothetical protein